MVNRALSTREIQAIFGEEISDAGGVLAETFDDGDYLIIRSTLSWIAEVRLNDQMTGGVALRATERDICIHPYLFRLVCRNGAIRAHAIETRRLAFADMLSSAEAATELREAVRGCCVEDVFAAGIAEVRSAVATPVDLALNLLPFLSRVSSQHGHEMLREILSRFVGERERSQFAFMNAVTSVARDTRDPELRWRLEELGGAIPVAQPPSHPFDPAIAAGWDDCEWRDPVLFAHRSMTARDSGTSVLELRP